MNGLLIGFFAVIAGFLIGILTHALMPTVLLWYREKYKKEQVPKGGSDT